MSTSPSRKASLAPLPPTQLPLHRRLCKSSSAGTRRPPLGGEEAVVEVVKPLPVSRGIRRAMLVRVRHLPHRPLRPAPPPIKRRAQRRPPARQQRSAAGGAEAAEAGTEIGTPELRTAAVEGARMPVRVAVAAVRLLLRLLEAWRRENEAMTGCRG